MGEVSFKDDIVAALPMLRAYARSLSGNADRADDLVQETLAKAIANRDKFREGTNVNAWLVVILRNHYYSEMRKRGREVADPDGVHTERLTEPGRQLSHLEMRDFLAALQMLPEDQREALILIGVSAFSYEEAAEVLGVRVGTVKSRVSRARARLEDLMSGEQSIDHDETAEGRSARAISAAMTP